MKNIIFKNSNKTLILLVFFVTAFSCERNLSDDVEFAKFASTAEVFIDNPVGMGTNFYFPYGGSKATAWSVDTETSYKGTASMRFDVPNANDPEGNYAGGIFRIDGAGRDLTGYDALTFWAKSSQATSLSEIGFGEDFEENKYITNIQNLSLTTNWVKYVIPIPDPSKLFEERGMLRYSASGIGPQGSEVGFTFWIDELKFEKLGTLAQPRPAILNGEDITKSTFIGVNMNITGLSETFNMGSGYDQTVSPAPHYFTFSSSNTDVAYVSENGVVSIIGAGNATITATLGGVKAAGSLTIESLGNFVPAPVPTRDAANVISVFSDAYNNIPVDFYNGYFAPYQTTQGAADINVNGDQIIKYTDLNFVATEFKNPTINISQMTHFHVDIQVQEPIESGDFIRVELGDFGPDNAFGGGDDSSGSVTIPGTDLATNQWRSFDIPIADFGLANKTNLAQIFFISDATISTILVDNMYFYK